jgi:hypothetical protein
MVVADESHKLMQGEKGNRTKALDNVRALTYHVNGLRERFERLHAKEYERLAELAGDTQERRLSEAEKKEYEEKVKLLISESKQVKNKLNLILLKKSNDDNFEKDPNELKFKELLTNNHSGAGLLANFDVYTGLKDEIEYLVYNNKHNFNLEVMRIRDKYITYSLKKHKKKVSVIKYFRKDNKEEYLLSCEISGGVAIIWDIQSQFNIINIFQEQISGNIYDAVLLFNI